MDRSAHALRFAPFLLTRTIREFSNGKLYLNLRLEWRLMLVRDKICVYFQETIEVLG